MCWATKTNEMLNKQVSCVNQLLLINKEVEWLVLAFVQALGNEYQIILHEMWQCVWNKLVIG